MRGPGHHLTGLAAGALITPTVGPEALAMVGAAWVGGTAPDWMELRIFGRRLIPHRRITHWLGGWLALAIFMLHAGISNPIALGFVAGALTHCLVDLPNPTGVPLFHPWERTSLNWWRSGNYDLLISALFFFAAGLRHHGLFDPLLAMLR